ncbi:neutral/alkaline non-lysosomal ceramidase N-terminal domain-containing protein [Mariniphaga sediminis]|nr:neutral/alkaline non-lysosomal ceramidase N-terminal domain-containing protein [Mariniphaga sediminis]
MKRTLIIVLLLVTGVSKGADMKVGIASRPITPPLPFWMSGYAVRNAPSTEVLHDIWAKAMVIEKNEKNRVVIVTTDLLGLSPEISEGIAQRVEKKHGVDRSQLLLNSSHTHCGPAVWPSLSMIFDFSPEDQRKAVNYNLKLIEDIVDIIDSAFAKLTPMQLWSGHGSTDFAMNRRQPTDHGIINGINPKGPVDHDVPVLIAKTPDGKIRAILFGYACHNTTLGGNSINISGDYAGFAQIELQKAYPEATALFFIGCAGDQNPQPRGTVDLAMQHGKSLTDAVQKVLLSNNLKPIYPPIRTAYQKVSLGFQSFNIDSCRSDILSSDIFKQRRAKLMLEAYNKNWDISEYTYPLQVVRFNRDLTILAMGDEVVVDYSLKMKKKYRNENLFVAGYCNQVMCYIPSKRVLEEGGYEAETSMIYYGLPGPFKNEIEDRITIAVSKLMKEVGVKTSKNNK